MRRKVQDFVELVVSNSLSACLNVFFYKQLMYKKRVLDWSKNKATFVLCSRKIKKLCNIKKEYNDLLPLVNFMIFVVKRLRFFILDIFRDDERSYPPRTVRFSNNKLTFGPENKKLIKKLVEC